MKFAITAAMGLLLAEQASAFAPFTPLGNKYGTKGSSSLAMALDMPPAATSVEVPAIQKSSYGPGEVRYSDFLKLVKGDKIEKVTFSADGTQLLGVDVDGSRLKIEALPNDPELLTELTSHKVRSTEIVLVILVSHPKSRVSHPFGIANLFRLTLPSCQHKKLADSASLHRASSSLLSFSEVFFF
jgi:hypothetical protein